MKYLYQIISAFLIFQNAYIEHREVKAAQGVKIAAKDLEKAIAGTWFIFKTKEFFMILYLSYIIQHVQFALSTIHNESSDAKSFVHTGLNLQVAQKPDEVDVLKEEIAKELSSALGNIRLAERGVYVQASTLGALEALLDFLKTSKIPVSARLQIMSSF
jgi:translation initiation factor 5B